MEDRLSDAKTKLPGLSSHHCLLADEKKKLEESSSIEKEHFQKELAFCDLEIASFKGHLEEASRTQEAGVLDKFWRSTEGHLEPTALLLKRGRIYRSQALEVNSNNQTLRTCKVCTLLKIYLKAKADVEEQYGSNLSKDAESGAGSTDP